MAFTQENKVQTSLKTPLASLGLLHWQWHSWAQLPYYSTHSQRPVVSDMLCHSHLSSV